MSKNTSSIPVTPALIHGHRLANISNNAKLAMNADKVIKPRSIAFMSRFD